MAELFYRLCQSETYWIYALDTLAPTGLNEELKINTIQEFLYSLPHIYPGTILFIYCIYRINALFVLQMIIIISLM